ncbi:dynamin family protein [Brevibacillus fluminis]|uniref:dynamin family protein n=1 Tax=Brevibacillus fluminis TaxID=511487 RepID=UPI003F8A9C96
MTIIHTADLLVTDVINILSNYKELQSIQEELQAVKARLKEPLRVAVVGVIKAGKTTLLNALMGEKLLKTGENETTFNVTWYKYGERPELMICLKDSRMIKEDVSLLNEWTTHNHANPEIKNVEYVIYKYPSPILKQIEFIDTPGLKSTHQDDAENTREFIGLPVNELADRTTSEGSKADAIIYAFQRGISDDENKMLEMFRNPLFSHASPINAIGVLTKVDMYWGKQVPAPMQEGKKIADRYTNHEEIRSLLYEIVPISAKMAENCRSLTEEHMEVLYRLSRLDEATLGRMFKGVHFFCDFAFPHVQVTPEERTRLYDTLGFYGVYVAIQAVREGITAPVELARHVSRQSGIPALSQKIRQHFGNRSFMIKFQYALSRIKSLCLSASITYRNHQDIKQKMDHIINRCDEIVAREHIFQEMEVLQFFYQGHLHVSEEESRELLEITGEYGSHCEARLGVEEGLSILSLARIAHEKSMRWIKKTDDIFSNRYEIQAARVIARSYEIMYFHLSSVSGFQTSGFDDGG